MRIIRPFTALRPLPECAAQAAAPPYDLISSERARVEAHGKPENCNDGLQAGWLRRFPCIRPAWLMVVADWGALCRLKRRGSRPRSPSGLVSLVLD